MIGNQEVATTTWYIYIYINYIVCMYIYLCNVDIKHILTYIMKKIVTLYYCIQHRIHNLDIVHTSLDVMVGADIEEHISLKRKHWFGTPGIHQFDQIVSWMMAGREQSCSPMVSQIEKNSCHMDVYSPEMYHTVLFTRTHRTHGNDSKCLEFLVDGWQISSIACMMRTCSAGLPRHSGQWQNVLALVHSSIEPGNKDGPGDGHSL